MTQNQFDLEIFIGHSLFVKFYGLNPRNFNFYSPKKLVSGAILHEILLKESMETQKFKFLGFKP
jgi:hypothetical protein